MQWYSVRGRIILKSVFVPTRPSIAWKKLGQPVPLSYFAADSKSGRLHAAQTNVPARCSWFSALVPGGSVASLNRMANASGDSSSRHAFRGLSSFVIGSVIEGSRDVNGCASVYPLPGSADKAGSWI